MVVDDWSIHLVFGLPEGSFHDEPRRYRATLDEALRLAHRDAATLAFGRTFQGFSKIEVESSNAPPRVTLHLTNPVRPTGELLARHGVSDPGVAAPQPARVAVALDEVEREPWWHFEGAAGPATGAGRALLGCASTVASEARQSVASLLESIAAQHQLFPVTAHALPAMVTLLESSAVLCRVELAAALELVARAAHEARDPMSKMLTWTARLVARELSQAMKSHQQAAKEVKTALHGLKPRLEAMKGDSSVGERVKVILALT
jgi:hypothetical protein